VVIGGSSKVPGGLRLTGESALRAGAGRLQLVTLDRLAVGLGMAIPEAAVLALPEDPHGELRWEPTDAIAEAIAGSDSVVIGPAMTEGRAAEAIAVAALADPRAGLAVVLDAAAIASAAGLASNVARFDGRVVLTPNRGEMAKLLDADLAEISRDPAGAV